MVGSSVCRNGSGMILDARPSMDESSDVSEVTLPQKKQLLGAGPLTPSLRGGLTRGLSSWMLGAAPTTVGCFRLRDVSWCCVWAVFRDFVA